MRILAIETVEITGSVAALVAGQVLVEHTLDPQQRSAQSLAPAIAAVLKETGWQPREVELVAVASGPGSFTGLRIGVTTAKAFAYGAGCQVLGVNTLLAVAEQAPANIKRLSVVLDAQRHELFVGEFVRDANAGWQGEASTRVIRADEWLASLAAGTLVTGTLVTGMGLKKLADRLPVGVTALPAEVWGPRAASIGQLARRQFEAGRRENVFELVPHYFRRTAAEEQWEKKQAAAG